MEGASIGPPVPDRMARFKIILLGEAHVGKSSLIRRFIHETFEESYLATIGASISKRIDHVDLADGSTVKVDFIIWDIMGNRKVLDVLGDTYFEGARGAVAVFDVTRRETFQVLGGWIETARHSDPAMPVMVLGNKNDLEKHRAIIDDDARDYCQAMDLAYMPASAKTGQNVQTAFQELAKQILNTYTDVEVAEPLTG